MNPEFENFFENAESMLAEADATPTAQQRILIGITSTMGSDLFCEGVYESIGACKRFIGEWALESLTPMPLFSLEIVDGLPIAAIQSFHQLIRESQSELRFVAICASLRYGAISVGALRAYGSVGVGVTSTLRSAVMLPPTASWCDSRARLLLNLKTSSKKRVDDHEFEEVELA